jgi:hypothetical protein
MNDFMMVLGAAFLIFSYAFVYSMMCIARDADLEAQRLYEDYVDKKSKADMKKEGTKKYYEDA